METLYPIFYGTRLVTFDVLRNTHEPYMHPEAARDGFNFILHQGGKFGIGGGFRVVQPDKPGFAEDGKSFHQKQRFPSGLFYAAWDMVVVNPGYVHRAPLRSEVPLQGTQAALDYGWHMNVDTEMWHGQHIDIDGWQRWVNAGRPDLSHRIIVLSNPRPQPPQPPVPAGPYPTTPGVTVEFTSRNLVEGSVGPDVKFYQRQLNEIAGQGLILDGHYGPKTTKAVKNWQIFFNTPARPLVADGQLGPKTQRSIMEISLQAA